MTNATAVVRPLPGSGLVIRAGDLLLVCDDGGREVDDLLNLVAEVAAAGGDGGVLVRRVAALLAADFDGTFPACAASGPTRDGRLAVLVYGTATADVATGDGDISLAGSDGITSVNRLISGPVRVVSLQLPGAGPADPRSRLDSGVVMAAGVRYSLSDVDARQSASDSDAPAAPDAAPNAAPNAAPDAAPAAPEGESSFGAAPAPESAFGPAPAPESALGPAPAPESAFGPAPTPRVSEESAPEFLSTMEGATPPDEPDNVTPLPPAPAEPAEQPAAMPPPAPVYVMPPPPIHVAPPVPPPPPPWSVDPEPLAPVPAQPLAPVPARPLADVPAQASAPAAEASAGPAPQLRQPDPAAPFVAVLLVPGAEGLGAEGMQEPPEPIVDLRPKVLGVLCANGHFNDPNLSECATCGRSTVEQTLVSHELPRPPLGVLVLDDGMTLRLDSDYVVGREPQADPDVASGNVRPLRITDADGVVSRRHLRVALVGWNVEVIDLGSANGTQVELPGDPHRFTLVPHQPVVIRPGTQVTMGRRSFRYESHRNP